MFDYKEIFEAWKISFNPTPIQEELAEKRLNICLGCEYRKEVLKGVKWSAYCGDCGCPINKKIFSKNERLIDINVEKLNLELRESFLVNEYKPVFPLT